MTATVRDNPAASRFELEIEGKLAFASYRRNGNVLYLPHVEAAVPLRGTGAADRLMRGVMEHARREGLRIVPTCSYAVAWMRRHREFEALRA